jgi:hypothetical protein
VFPNGNFSKGDNSKDNFKGDNKFNKNYSFFSVIIFYN